MRDVETALQEYGEFLLRARLVSHKAAPFCVRWVRRFLGRPATDERPVDQVRRFLEDLEREARVEDWQVRQAEHALQIFFVNVLGRADWHQEPAATQDQHGRTDPLAVLDAMRHRLRLPHYAYRTEASYVDWARRFLQYLAERQQHPAPSVDAAAVRDYLTHLAVRRGVSASTQNQMGCALLFLCREILRVDVEGLNDVTRARRGRRLPTVLSVPEMAALLGALRGTPWLMAALISTGAGYASPSAGACASRMSTNVPRWNPAGALDQEGQRGKATRQSAGHGNAAAHDRRASILMTIP